MPPDFYIPDTIDWNLWKYTQKSTTVWEIQKKNKKYQSKIPKRNLKRPSWRNPTNETKTLNPLDPPDQPNRPNNVSFSKISWENLEDN